MPDDRTVEIDLQSGAFLADRHQRFAELRRTCPVVWNREGDGQWIVTDYESVAAVARDNATFAHRYERDPEPDGFRYLGILGSPRPPGAERQGVSEIDGPEHADLRRLLHPFLTPQEVARVRRRAVGLARDLVDEFIEVGEADLVHDYASPLPAILTLEMMGIPSDNWKHFADFFHATTSYPRRSPEFSAAASHWGDMMAEILEHADRRRREPADDITSALVTTPLDGKPLADQDIGNIMWNLIAGGIDTTTALVGWGLHHLGTHPEARDQLLADRSLVPTAIEEFLRHYSPNEALTRTATRDVELGGRQIKRGDMVLISWVSANHDEAMFPEPDVVRVDRAVNRHLSFGLGGHRCIGSNLARMESEVLLTEVLDRLPDYRIVEDGFEPAPPNLLVTGVASLPVTFTPGTRRDDAAG